MRYQEYKLSRGERFFAIAPKVAKWTVAGLALAGIGWAAHEIITAGPPHVGVHDFITGNWHYGWGWGAGISVDHIDGSALINGHHTTVFTPSDAGGYGVLTGNEFTVHDTAAGSDKVFDVMLNPNSNVANYQFNPGTVYDLQGKEFAEVVGHTNSGADIKVPLLYVNGVTVDNGSTGLMNNLASVGLTGGLIGAARGLTKFSRLK